jgi:hypothetical protein
MKKENREFLTRLAGLIKSTNLAAASYEISQRLHNAAKRKQRKGRPSQSEAAKEWAEAMERWKEALAEYNAKTGPEPTVEDVKHALRAAFEKAGYKVAGEKADVFLGKFTPDGFDSLKEDLLKYCQQDVESFRDADKIKILLNHDPGARFVVKGWFDEAGKIDRKVYEELAKRRPVLTSWFHPEPNDGFESLRNALKDAQSKAEQAKPPKPPKDRTPGSPKPSDFEKIVEAAEKLEDYPRKAPDLVGNVYDEKTRDERRRNIQLCKEALTGDLISKYRIEILAFISWQGATSLNDLTRNGAISTLAYLNSLRELLAARKKELELVDKLDSAHGLLKDLKDKIGTECRKSMYYRIVNFLAP